MVQNTFDQIIRLARQLSPMDKRRLIENLAPGLEAAIATKPARGLRGIFKGAKIGDEEIQEGRREMLRP